jgi:hypothetical protein
MRPGWHSEASDWSSELGKDFGSLRKKLHQDNGLLAMYDQCSAVALMLNRFKGIQIAYMKALSSGRCSSVLCVRASPAVGAGSSAANGQGDMVVDPMGQVNAVVVATTHYCVFCVILHPLRQWAGS